MEAAFGYPAGTVPRGSGFWRDHVHPDDRARVLGSIHAAIDGDADRWAAEYRFLRADGSAAVVLDRGIVARDAEGRATRMIGSMQDITERKVAEEALRESEERFRALHETSPDGFAILRSQAAPFPASPMPAAPPSSSSPPRREADSGPWTRAGCVRAGVDGNWWGTGDRAVGPASCAGHVDEQSRCTGARSAGARSE